MRAMSPLQIHRIPVVLALGALLFFAGCLAEAPTLQPADTDRDMTTPPDDQDEGDASVDPAGPGDVDADENGTEIGNDNGTAGNGTAGDGAANETEPAPTWPDIDAATIRPGTAVVFGNSQCTANFVFRSLDNGTLYLGVAAHCVGHLGQSVKVGATRIGSVAYSSWDSIGFAPGDADVGDDVHPHDFALIEIDEAMAGQVHPAVRHFGGPVALGDAEALGFGSRVLAYGNSGLRPGPEPLDRQEGVLFGVDSTSEAESFYTLMSGAVPGDSGSGLMSKDGKALGALSVISVGVPGGVEHVYSSIPFALSHLEREGWSLELQTWELLDNGVLP